MARPDLADLRVTEGVEPVLGVREHTHATAGMEDKDAGEDLLDVLQERVAELQERLWAENARAVLLVLQGMDTAGKSGTMRRVFPLVSPQGVQVAAFKQPSDRELDHDYLWRVHASCPSRGTIGVFDRSHYEDVGIVRVNGWIDEDTVRQRYRQINDFERMLVENGTVVRKVFLDISHEQQREELQERIDEPDKNWKFSHGDLEVRAQWHDYMHAYREAMAATSTDHAPWYRIPADRRWVSGACVAQLLVDTLEEMDPQPPPPADDLDGVEIPALDD
ncbi:PPK2 family polyphosphate kinase [Salsipaludibacter albus]|uniref:PPK2 family polyphosphate kinase n=1 Tax=Salsipaludibacter albus TaxID=2849650 RepID=UPI001EE43120|nr:PPK2 family polyphosphate kinase [Salsipaludibacter albus]MBY5162790.1 polyphosphate kinase 2 family protein [Salsipaludibacter albus]